MDHIYRMYSTYKTATTNRSNTLSSTESSTTSKRNGQLVRTKGDDGGGYRLVRMDRNMFFRLFPPSSPGSSTEPSKVGDMSASGTRFRESGESVEVDRG